MGGSFDEVGRMVSCDGADVLKALNDAFGNPASKAYQYAQSNNTFGAIQNAPDNYLALIGAYTIAGVSVSQAWGAYLRLLGTVGTQGPQNISDIAQMRYNCLLQGQAMNTVVHDPKNGGHVHTTPGSGGAPSTIDSPCPLQLSGNDTNRR